MSLAPETMVACPDIQGRLDNYINTCSASSLREDIPFFDFLWSDANRTGIQQSVVPGGGKTKTLQLVYSQRILESEVQAVSSCDGDCTATSVRGNLSTDYSIDCTGIKSEGLFTPSDWRTICESNDMILEREIQALIDAVVRKQASNYATQAGALLGGWASDVSVVTNDYLIINTEKPSSSDINPGFMQDIDFATMQSGFCNGKVIFANADLFKKYGTMQAGCCSSQGVDLSQMLSQYNAAVLYDYRVASVAQGLKANSSWVVMPQALQPLYLTMNDNNIPLKGANYFKTVVFDRTGFPLDLTMSDNCGAISVVVTARSKVVSLPLDMFAPGDRMEGVNYFAGIQTVNT